MIAFALEYRASITEFTANATNNLRKWELNEHEWGLLTEIHKILKVRRFFVPRSVANITFKPLKRATVYFSKTAPIIADVIPTIDEFDRLFTTLVVELHTETGEKERIEISSAFKTSLILASRTLNKYYQLTDETSVYRIAMSTSDSQLLLQHHALPGTHSTTVLHPTHKLEYFADNDWSNTWISEAKDALQATWRDEYAGRDDLVPEVLAEGVPGSSSVPTVTSVRVHLARVSVLLHSYVISTDGVKALG